MIIFLWLPKQIDRQGVFRLNANESLMNWDIPQIDQLLQNRRAIFPNMYADRPIERDVLEAILEKANWAPTHRRTEPWRFQVFTGEARQRLADYLGDYYRTHTPAEKFSEKKYEKTLRKPLQSGAVIAICMQRDPDERVPEWEEVAAVAMAVQNMWLSCTARGIGCYWSSPASILQADSFLELPEGQRCLGLLYMGYYDGAELPGQRNPIEEKVTWRDF
jgi:nitroreductase